MIFVKSMKKNRTHKKPKFTQEPYKVAGVDIITPDDEKSSATIAKNRLLASIASTRAVEQTQSESESAKLAAEATVDAHQDVQQKTTSDSVTDSPITNNLALDGQAADNTKPNQPASDDTLTNLVATPITTATHESAPMNHNDDNKSLEVQATPQNNEHPKQDESKKVETGQFAVPSSVTPVPYPKEKKEKKNWLPLIVIGLLVGLGLGYCAGGKSQKQSSDKASHTTTHANSSAKPANGANNVADNQAAQTAQKTPVMAVEAVSLSEFVQTDSLIADGVIAGHKTAMVGSKASGLSIEEVLVDVGDRVKAGQVLAILDDKFAEQEVVAMTADKKQAEINLARVNSDFERIQSLMDINAISWQQYDQYKATKLQAEAQLEAINARLANTARQEKNTKVVAPVSGVISERLAEVGMVTTGGALFGIVKTDKLEWRANIKASDRQKVSVGQTVRLKNGVTGKVARISPTANASRDLTVFVPLDNAKTPVGSYHTGEFVLASKAVLTVPAKVVMSYDGGDYVWTLTKVDDKTLADNGYEQKSENLGVFVAKKQPLDNAKRLGDKVAVNLPKETLIIKAGGNFLSEGDWVTLTKINNESSNPPDITPPTTDTPNQTSDSGE